MIHTLHAENANKFPLWKHNAAIVELAKRTLARKSLVHFIQYLKDDYVPSWHHELICKKLDDWIAGKITRLMVFAPPQNGKSIICSEFLPAYILGKDPKAKIILASYAQERATGNSRKVRANMMSSLYKHLFPNTILTRASDRAKTEGSSVQMWGTISGGSLRCAGTRGGITGFGLDYGIIDDPVKDRVSAESKKIREESYSWYKSTFYSRQGKDARILIIQTRWHTDDLSGWLLQQSQQNPYADKWEVLSLPAILDCKPCKGDRRKKGEALWPARYHIEKLNEMKSNTQQYDWESLYQQRPLPVGGGKIKQHWFNIVDHFPEDLHWVRYWDLATSTKTSADYTASACLAIDRENNVYIKDIVRGKWEWPVTRKIIIDTALNEQILIVIESYGVQQGIYSDLIHEKQLANIPILNYNVHKDKLTRALPWISRAEAGKIHLIRGMWVNDFLYECSRFTGRGDSHDDQIDAVSGAYSVASERLNTVTERQLLIR